VVVLEKESLPRYRIGESLLPYCYFPLQRIGMIDTLKASAFTKKYSVQFVRPDGHVSQPFYFDRHLDHDAAQTWQVSRGEFDQMLVENARAKGVTVLEQTKVTRVLREDGRVAGVEAEDARGQAVSFRAKMTMDASGREALTMGRNRWRVPDKELKKIAIWTYFEGAKRDEGRDEGATTVAYVGGKNWFWYIPLTDNRVSVGLVGDKEYLYRGTRDAGEIFERETANNEWIRDHLASGQRVEPYQVTSDFSYRSEYCAEDGLVLVGDAFAFLDPVFSSGVLLALKSGELAADAVHAALEANDVSAARFAAYGQTLCRGIEDMRRLIYTFYDEQFSFRSVLEKYPHLKTDITDCLIGRLDRDYDELFAAVAEFAPLPAPLAHGRPLECVAK
jgi:flavin-dependent dehydrogenase